MFLVLHHTKNLVSSMRAAVVWTALLVLLLVQVAAAALCASDPTGQLALCHSGCCGTSTCVCNPHLSAVRCEYRACVAAALEASGCTTDASYAAAYSTAVSTAAACAADFAVSSCPSVTQWADAARCSIGLECSALLTTQCTASCMAKTLLCYVGARCGVGLSVAAVNYCQWLLGDVANAGTAAAVGDGPLGQCLTNLNGSTALYYSQCVSASVEGGLFTAEVPCDDREAAALRVAVGILCGALGVAIIAGTCFAVRLCLSRALNRRPPEHSEARSASDNTGVGAHRRISDSGEAAAAHSVGRLQSSGGKGSVFDLQFLNSKPQAASESDAGHLPNTKHASTPLATRADDSPRSSASCGRPVLRIPSAPKPASTTSVVEFVGSPIITMTGQQARRTSEVSTLATTAREGLALDHSRAVATLVKQGMCQQLKKLGEGATGVVHSYVLSSGAIVARKDVRTTSFGETEIKLLHEELRVVSKICHPNCVRYYASEFSADKGVLSLWMEYVSGGTLASLCSSALRPLAESAVRSYVRQIVNGLVYLHSRGIVHRDIKAENILLDGGGVVKIADFGCSKTILSSGRKLGVDRSGSGGSVLGLHSGSSVTSMAGASLAAFATSMVGTPYFMAPEVIGNTTGASEGSVPSFSSVPQHGYGVQADVWSLGVTACQLLNHGEMPWPKMDSYWELMLHITQHDPVIPSRVSPECKAFLKLCFTRDPRQRPTAKQLLECDWFADTTSNDRDEGIEDMSRDAFGFRECQRALVDRQHNFGSQSDDRKASDANPLVVQVDESNPLTVPSTEDAEIIVMEPSAQHGAEQPRAAEIVHDMNSVTWIKFGSVSTATHRVGLHPTQSTTTLQTSAIVPDFDVFLHSVQTAPGGSSGTAMQSATPMLSLAPTKL